ncbi:hypothetical protein IEQ34_001668 [Dendrobium chrysotoxum]|uniref:Pectinesterase n=1 Tax=Dendrobium chrysotoxum TaxID=161865 RepID=A0AAV7HPN4_DENCH|nr:hypothetical protein IEQ34_001668 [Dendrobium chrysotoxum]
MHHPLLYLFFSFSFFFFILPTTSSPSPELIQACKSSRFPDSCSQRLSSTLPSLPPSPSASTIILSVFNSSLHDIPTAISITHSILANSPTASNLSSAAHNCLEVLPYSFRRLSAVSNISSADARYWAAAAQQYQSGCSSTLQAAKTSAFIAELANRTSDGLAMLAALQRYGTNMTLWAPAQTERDGYWGPPTSSESYDGSRGVPKEMAVNLTVCGEGDWCDHRTVQEAVDDAPENVTGEWFVIRIGKGVYDEIVRVPFEKTNLVFLGDGMGRTVITGNLSVGVPGISTYTSATVAVAGDGFMARDLTIRNTAGPESHQAVAFRSSADHTVLDTVEISGHQDTLYPHSLRQFYRSCVISGTVDFIFGNAAAVFEDCLLLILPRQLNPTGIETDTITAHGRADPAQPTGFVFRRCVVNGSAEYWTGYTGNPAVHRVYLGRPWKEYSRTVFVESYLEGIVRPEGWTGWAGDFGLSTLYYGEYRSGGPGANAGSRVTWSDQIPAVHVGVYSVDNFIQGDRWIPQVDL